MDLRRLGLTASSLVSRTITVMEGHSEGLDALKFERFVQQTPGPGDSQVVHSIMIVGNSLSLTGNHSSGQYMIISGSP